MVEKEKCSNKRRMSNIAERKKNGRIKGLINNMWLILYYTDTQFNLSLSGFVPNYRIVSLVVPEKSLMEKRERKMDK